MRNEAPRKAKTAARAGQKRKRLVSDKSQFINLIEVYGNHKGSAWALPSQRSPDSQRRKALPFLVFALSRLPALSKFPGHRPAQEAACPAAGNGSMFWPSSANAVTRSIPAIVPSRGRRLSPKGMCGACFPPPFLPSWRRHNVILHQLRTAMNRWCGAICPASAACNSSS